MGARNRACLVPHERQTPMMNSDRRFAKARGHRAASLHSNQKPSVTGISRQLLPQIPVIYGAKATLSEGPQVTFVIGAELLA